MTAQEFRDALDTLGWSYSQAAERLGVTSRQRVGEWVRGERDIPPYIARSVGLALQLKACREALDATEDLPLASA